MRDCIPSPSGPGPSADGIWHGLLPVQAPDAARCACAPGARASIVVQQGADPVGGPDAAVPAAWQHLPRRQRGGRLGHAGPGRLPHPSGVRRPARQRVSRCAWPVPRTKRSPRRVGALCRRSRPRVRRRKTSFCPGRPACRPCWPRGVCAIEIKSGYGLALAHERKQLRVARRLGEVFGVTVRTTFWARTPCRPNTLGRSQDYIDLVCNEMLPALAAEGLVDAVDVFCERIAFTLAETEQVFQAAQSSASPSSCMPSSCRTWGRGAGGPLRRAVVRPHRAPVGRVALPP